MKAAIITVAGISSRFNEGVPEAEKQLKAIYTEDSAKNTLLYRLVHKCMSNDVIIIVGGYRFESLDRYCSALEPRLREKLRLVRNEHYEELGSGYSLYLGLCEAFRYHPEEILFVEGDLDIDEESFKRVLEADKSVLTYTYEPIYANKAVVLYADPSGHYRYVFNSKHGLLCIDSPFSCIFNSGQVWKFREMKALKEANDRFYDETREGTNLQIIQSYLDKGVELSLVPLKRWTNCNTREDYKKILLQWEAEH